MIRDASAPGAIKVNRRRLLRSAAAIAAATSLMPPNVRRALTDTAPARGRGPTSSMSFC